MPEKCSDWKSEAGKKKTYEGKGHMQRNKDVIEINAAELFWFMLKRWYVFLLSVLLAAAAGLSICLFIITPQYESTTKIIILSPQNSGSLTYSDMQLASQLTKDYEELIVDRDVLEAVIAQCALEDDYEDLLDRVTVENIPDTRIISITVEDPSPAMAQRIADSIRDTAAEHIRSVTDVEAVNVTVDANLPLEPSSPSKPLWAALPAALALLIVFVIQTIRFLSDDAIKSPEDVNRYLGISMLALVPKVHLDAQTVSASKGQKGRGKNAGVHDGGKRTAAAQRAPVLNNSGGSLTANPDGDGQSAVTLRPGLQDYDVLEAFKTLRANIEFYSDNVKVICITSVFPGDGKSTVSYHLARAFAETGKKTLLIDADLRKSVLRKMVWKSGDPGQGLSYYLSGRRKYEETICRTDLRTLDIVFAGQFPPNPSELLGGRQFAGMIEQAKKEYAVIIIDTPPMGSVIDAAVAAKVCDGSVLVIKDGAVSFRMAQRSKSQLEAAKTPILGCVLNEVDLSSNRYYGRYYKTYYGNYYRE